MLPKLYSRTSLGQIQTWEIEVNKNSYVTREGVQGGKITESKPTICLAKNEGKKNATTAEEQSLKEAVAFHSKKIKSGGYWEDIGNIDGQKFTEPMLAESLKDYEHKVVYPCMVDRKYNGGRIIAKKEGLFTRKGEKYKTIPHIEEALAPLFKKYPQIILDGEGYNHDYRFQLNMLMSILRVTKESKITPLLLQESKEKVLFYVCDGFNFEDVTAESPGWQRREGIKKILKDIEFIEVVPYRMAANREEIDIIYSSFLSDGYEGAMIRNAAAPYQFKRSRDLLKMKPLDDSEGVVLSINCGIGNAFDLAATATLEWKGLIFDATFKGTEETRRGILNNKEKWIGKEVTFMYNGLTGLNVPNYGRVDPLNCFKK